VSTENVGVVAVVDQQATGAIVWWRLTGDVDVDVFQKAWLDAGLMKELLPEPPTPNTALGRAMREMSERRRLVRSLKGNKGWGVVNETATDTTLDYQMQIKASIEDGKLKVEPAGHNLSDEVKLKYATYCNSYTITDTSALLCSTVKALKAVPLRDTGGVYFVPRDQIPELRKVVTAIKSVSDHRVFEVPALRSDEAIEAILSALIAEADSETSAMETEFDTTELGGRALRTRAGKAEALLAKVKEYETLLGKNLSAVTERVVGLKDALVTAALAAEQEAA
jgi:hypothetical protein